MTRNEQILQVLKVGDVILTDTKASWWNPLGYFYRVVRWYQRQKYPDSKRTGDIHAMLVLETDPVRVFSYEAPCAVIKGFGLDSRTKYRICRYLPADAFPLPEFGLLLREAAEHLKGRDYDYGQNIAILVKWLFPWSEMIGFRIFDRGRNWKVCSVGVHWCFLYWWRNYWRAAGRKGLLIKTEQDAIEWAKELVNLPCDARTYPRPLGKQPVELTCPATFANHPDTFKVVWEET